MNWKKYSRKFYLVLAVDAMVIAMLLYGSQFILSSPGSDIISKFENGKNIITGFRDEAPPKWSLQIGDTLIWQIDDNLEINSPFVYDFFGPRYRNNHLEGIRKIGDTIHIRIARSNSSTVVPYVLVQCNKTEDVLSAWIVGCFFIIIGLFTYLKRQDDPSALLFHWMTIAIAVALTNGFIVQGNLFANIWTYLSWISGSLIRMALYSLILHFSLIFPRDKIRGKKWLLFFIYLPVLIELIFQNFLAYSWIYFGPSSIEIARWHSFLPIFGWRNLIFLILSFISFLHSYFSAKDQAVRKKILWAIMGIAFSLMIAITNVILGITSGYGILPIPGWIFSVGYVIAPICIAIAITRYQLFNIDTIVNRSVVYIGVIGFLALVYEGIVHVVALILHGTFTRDDSVVTSTLATVAVALLFEPAKERTQHLIDKKFYRTKYNYRQASVTIAEAVTNAGDAKEIATIVVEELDRLIQVERIGFYMIEQPGNTVLLLAHHNCDVLQGHELTLDLRRLQAGEHLPLGAENLVEADAKAKRLPPARFNEWGLALIVPLYSERKDVLGFIVLGRKKSEMKFTLEDVDLLRSVATQSELAIERLQHQVLIRMRHEEEERRKELQKMKIVTGTGIPHELDVLIDNGGYYKKIEQGTLLLAFERCKPNDLINGALKSLAFPLAMDHFEVQVNFSTENILVNCDKSAIELVLRTLLSNAMKYGGTRKFIGIATSIQGSDIEISIQDKGIGISDEEKLAIFEPFFRGLGKDASASGGSGLGLTVAKHIIIEHKGNIHVESILGEGSKFIIQLPVLTA